MSLQVWLPLDGDLKNLGLDDVTPVLMGTGITYTNGKIGKAATFPNSCSSCIHFPGYKYINNFSWTCWFKCIGQGSGAYQFILSEGRDVGSCGLNLRLNKAGTTMFLSFMNISNSGYTATICNINLNIWYHVAITISKDLQLKVYLNGEQIYTIEIGALDYAQSNDRFVIGKMAYSYTSTSNYFPFNGQVNDVRIYDHCLSPKEIKEISKGLVAHYPLNDYSITNFSGEGNIMPNYKDMGLGKANPSTGTWRIAGTNNMTRSRIQIMDSPVGSCYCFQNVGIQTANDGSCYDIDNFPLEADTEYRISMFARITDGSDGYAGFSVYSISSELGGSHTGIQKNYRITPLNADGSWTYCWYHIKTNSSTTRNIYIGIVTGETSVTTQMCLVRIEKWQDWFEDTTVYDCSGYCHHGINTNTTANVNTPRYFVSTKFDGTNYITLTNNSFPTVLSNDFTLSMWVYSDDDGDRSLWFGNYSISGGGNFFGLEKTTSDKVRFWWNAGNPDKYFNATSVTKSDGWVLLTLVKEGNVAKIYRNGVLSESNTNDNYNTISLPITASTFRLGADGRTTGNTLYKGSMSDIRIYATALSADDIKELYETSASIDNHGNMWAYEIQEV